MSKLKTKRKVLFMTLCICGLFLILFNAQGPVNAADGGRPQSGFFTDINGVTVTDLYTVPLAKLNGGTPSVQYKSADYGREGVLVESTATGNAAEGSGFKFADEMSGVFKIEFRVFSEKTYAKSTANPGEAHPNYSDAVNPFLDLKQLSFTITDSVSGKSFTVYVTGGTSYQNTVPMLEVKTGNMEPTATNLTGGRGLIYKNFSTTPESVGKSGYKTRAYGSTFSNYAFYNTSYHGIGGQPTVLEFDPSDMCVYTYSRIRPSQDTVKILVLDLSNPDHVDAENVIEKGTAFNNYTVEVKFEDLTPDNYTDTYITEPYARKARMVIYNLNGYELSASNKTVTITENYSHASLDGEKSGLLLQSTLTGNEAEGTTFRFKNNFSDAFKLDYRVFSEQAFPYLQRNAYSSTHAFGTDELNPYLDLRKVSFTFIDEENDKSFTVYASGTVRSNVVSTMYSVKTGTMAEDKGLKYKDYKYSVLEGFNTYGYKTVAYGTSFSNVAIYAYVSGNDSRVDSTGIGADGGRYSSFEFDPTDMCVYTYTYLGQTLRKIKVIDLSDSDHVGEDNVIAKGSAFDTYTVKVTFEEVTADSYTDDFITQAYDRTAKMILYAINDEDIDSSDISLDFNDTTSPVAYIKHTAFYVNDNTQVVPYVYDAFEGNSMYKGELQYYTSYDPTVVTVPYDEENGYVINFTSEGTATIILGGVSDGSGNVSAEAQFTVPILGRIAVNFNDGMEDKTVYVSGDTLDLSELTVNKPDCQLVGWQIEGEEGLYAPDGELTVESDITLVPVFIDLRMISGASIRIALDGTDGIRFTGVISKSYYDELKSLAEVELYYTMEVEEYQPIKAVIPEEKLFTNASYGDVYVTTAALFNLNRYDLRIKAVVSIEVTYADDTVREFFADEPEDNWRTISQVAAMFKADTEAFDMLSEAQKAIVDKYIIEE